MWIVEYLLYTIVGAFAGIISGLLGIGGGIIVIPSLLIIFQILGFPPHIMQTILATSLSAMVFNTLSALISQQLRKNIAWSISLKLIAGTVIGCLVGVKIAYDMSSETLKMVFGIFMCLIGGYVYKRAHRVVHPDPKVLSGISLAFIGFGNSTLSTLLGISGGLFMIPVLQELHFPLKKSIGIASATNFVTALIGSFFFIVLHPSNNSLPFSIGPVYLPAFVCVGISAALFAPLGVKLSHEIHTSRLQKVFALVMFFAGLYMLLSKN